MTSPSPQIPPAAPHSGAVRGLFIAAFAVYLALSVWIAWRAAMLAPYSDMFDLIARYYALGEGMDLPTYLLAPHNFHRLFWMFGILALDIRGFGAQGYLFPLTSGLCLAAAAFLLAREAWRAAEGAMRLPVAGAAAMLALMSVNLWAVGLHIHSPYLHVLVFAVAAIVASQPMDGQPLSAGRSLAVLALAAAAALGNAAGLILWPVLLAGALRFGGQRRWLAAITISGLAFGGLYLTGQTAAAEHAVGPSAGALLPRVLLFLNFLALPWTRALPAAGWLMGAGVLALSTAAVLRTARPEATRSERVAVLLILYSLGAALLAALGRIATVSPENIAVRYATFLTPLHVGLLILAAPGLSRLSQRAPRAAGAAGLACAVVLIAHQLASGAVVIAAADANRRMLADFKAGLRTPAMRQTVHPRLDIAERIESRLRRDGYFQSELHLPAAPQRRPPRS